MKRSLALIALSLIAGLAIAQTVQVIVPYQTFTLPATQDSTIQLKVHVYPSSSSGSSSSGGSSSSSSSSGSSSSSSGSSSSSSSSSSSGGSSSSSSSSGGSSGGNLAVYLTNMSTNSETIAFSGAPAGSTYNVYRNGTKIATAATSPYTDDTAANAVSTGFNFGPPTYAYSVTSAQGGVESAPAYPSALIYAGGVYSWESDYSDITANYKSTAVASADGGPYVISITNTGSNGYWQPYSGPTMSPQWAMDVGALGYFEITLQPTVSGTQWQVGLFSRVPTGDIYPYGNAYVVLPGSYGPPSVAGQWATYKIPLSAFQKGFNTFTASISGQTMTVTSAPIGVSIEPAMWVTGPGVPAGTYVTANPNNTYGSGGIGIYNLNNAATVASETMRGQDTNGYKFYIDTGAATPSTPLYYADDLILTTN